MAQQQAIEARERFKEKLQEAASKRAIPIEKLDKRDVPDRNAFELVARSGGKERVFTITDSALINDPQAEIEQIINVLVDNE